MEGGGGVTFSQEVEAPSVLLGYVGGVGEVV